MTTQERIPVTRFIPGAIQIFPTPLPPISCWGEWLWHWERANASQREGLLHCGFKVPIGDYHWMDRINAYMMVADGWAGFSSLDVLDEYKADVEYPSVDSLGRGDRESALSLRKRLAEKAFIVLTQEVFDPIRNRSKYRYFRGSLLERVTYCEHLKTSLMQFFQPYEKEGKMTIRNLTATTPCKNFETIPRLLLTGLAHEVFNPHYLAGFSRLTREDEIEIEKRRDELKPWLLEVLAFLGQLSMLGKTDWLMALNEECLAKLEEIALRALVHEWNEPLSRERIATSVAEAAALDSKAARLLLLRKDLEGVYPVKV